MSAVLVFTGVYTVALFTYGRAMDSPLTNLYTGINVGLLLLFGVLHLWARWSERALWAASLVGLGNMLGGVLLVRGEPLYVAQVIGPIRYDKVFHAVAATGMTLIAWEAMRRWAGVGHNVGGLLLLTWLVVMGGGAVVEIAEFIGSSMSEVSVGDYGNNALDLVANATGAAIALPLVLWLDKRTPAQPAVTLPPSPTH
jgi:hypothetical protein